MLLVTSLLMNYYKLNLREKKQNSPSMTRLFSFGCLHSVSTTQQNVGWQQWTDAGCPLTIFLLQDNVGTMILQCGRCPWDIFSPNTKSTQIYCVCMLPKNWSHQFVLVTNWPGLCEITRLNLRPYDSSLSTVNC